MRRYKNKIQMCFQWKWAREDVSDSHSGRRKKFKKNYTIIFVQSRVRKEHLCKEFGARKDYSTREHTHHHGRHCQRQGRHRPGGRGGGGAGGDHHHHHDDQENLPVAQDPHHQGTKWKSRKVGKWESRWEIRPRRLSNWQMPDGLKVPLVVDISERASLCL